MTYTSKKWLQFLTLTLAVADFGLVACKTSVSKTKTAGSSDPVCSANYGSGYGQIYQCGSNYCAKQNPDYTGQCVVDHNDPCNSVAVSSSTSGESIDPSKPVWDVGSGMYFNACEANGGQGYGNPWSCGNGQCANVTAASPSYTFCRVRWVLSPGRSGEQQAAVRRDDRPANARMHGTRQQAEFRRWLLGERQPS